MPSAEVRVAFAARGDRTTTAALATGEALDRELAAALLAAGIGALRIATDAGIDELDTLIEVLARIAGPGTVGAIDPAAGLLALDLPGVRVEPLPSGSSPQRPDPDALWSQLPPPGPAAGPLARAVERELAANLPLLAATALLLDIGHDATSTATTSSLLQELFGELLLRGDAAAASALLTQAEQHPAVPLETAMALRAQAIATIEGEWLTAQLRHATAEEILGLLSLAMQLGDAAVQKVLDDANRAGAPMPPSLHALLPRT